MKRRLKKLLPAKLTGRTGGLRSVVSLDAQNLPETVPEEVPRITNETVAEHREEVLKGARKFIYPLQHSKHRIVIITTGIIIAAAISFLAYCLLALYKFKSNNTFLYRVTQVVSFPIARTGGTYIAYENYLFELRHYIHYYETQLQRDFQIDVDRQQLLQYRKEARDKVVNDAYVKILADKNRVSVSDREVDTRIALVRAQNRLGSSSRVFEDVLRSYWGWSVRDFRRSLKQEILKEKVIAKLDVATNQKAADGLAKLKAGANFVELAKQISDDPSSKGSGGSYGFTIDKNNRDVPPQVVEALFKLKPGEFSGVINTGSSLEIVKLQEITAGKAVASHIVFALKDAKVFIDELKAKQKTNFYVTL